MIFTEKAYGLPRENLESLYDIEARLPRTVAESTSSGAQPLKTESAQAIIAVDGVLFPKQNILTFFGFGTALSDIQYLLAQAVSDPGVSKIILIFSSPGGSVTGVNELANFIKGIDKPTVAYVSGMAASAAYWLAAACDQIVVDATATLGSIGVVGIYSAKSEREIEIVSSGAPHKRPDLETDDGRRIAQNYVDSLEAVFISALTRLRTSLTTERINDLGGDVRVGSKAVQAGLADSLGSLQGVLQNQQITNPKVSDGESHAIESGWRESVNRVNAMNGSSRSKHPQNTGISSSDWGAVVAKINAKRSIGR